MPYTTHGHWYGEGEPTQPGPAMRARCGGVRRCDKCRHEAGILFDFDRKPEARDA